MEFWFEKNLPTGTTIPAVNIKENNENFTVEMDAPVMNENDFYVKVNGNTLIITSEKNQERQPKEVECCSRKKFSGQSFSRLFKRGEAKYRGPGVIRIS